GGAVGGYVDDSPLPVAGNIDISGSGFELECAQDTGTVWVDVIPPTGTITSHNTGTGSVQGTAADNYGIAKVQIYDGPVLMASDDAGEAATSDVSLITFSGGSFLTVLEATPE